MVNVPAPYLSLLCPPIYRAVYLHRFRISANMEISRCIFPSKSLLKECDEKGSHLRNLLCLPSTTQRRIHISFSFSSLPLQQRSPAWYTFFISYLWCFSDLGKAWRVAFTMMLHRDRVDRLSDADIFPTRIHLPINQITRADIFCRALKVSHLRACFGNGRLSPSILLGKDWSKNRVLQTTWSLPWVDLLDRGRHTDPLAVFH